MEITKHFTVSIYLINKRNELLLHYHKKLNLWLPVGGHIERDELPTDAAIREAKEESGMNIKLIDFDELIDLVDGSNLIRPINIMVQNINPFHQHIDFGYAAKAQKENFNPNEGESTKIIWVNIDEIEEIDTPKNVKVLYKLILKKLYYV